MNTQRDFDLWQRELDRHLFSLNSRSRSSDYRPDSLWYGFENKLTPVEFLTVGHTMSLSVPSWINVKSNSSRLVISPKAGKFNPKKIMMGAVVLLVIAGVFLLVITLQKSANEAKKIALKSEIELSAGTVREGSENYTLEGTITNTSNYRAPRVTIFGVITAFKRDAATTYHGYLRFRLGTLSNMKPGESRPFTFSAPIGIAPRDIPKIEEPHSFDESIMDLRFLKVQAPVLEFEVGAN